MWIADLETLVSLTIRCYDLSRLRFCALVSLAGILLTSVRPVFLLFFSTSLLFAPTAEVEPVAPRVRRDDFFFLIFGGSTCAGGPSWRFALSMAQCRV